MTDSAEKAWRNWGCEDWNRALFEHFFLDLDGTDDHQVSCLPISKEVLARIAEADIGEASEVQDAFVDAVGRNGTTLETEFKYSYWMKIIQENPSSIGSIPPFFAHLALTCLAACGDEDIRTDRDFRRRLSKLVRTSHNFRVPDLALIWSLLEKWIEIMRNAGKPYRRIALPDPRHRTIIGHSIELGFPSIAEQKTLDEFLSAYRGEFPPPYREVIALLDARAGAFKERFRKVYLDFKASLDGEGDSSLHPFWVAVTNSSPSSAAAPEDPEYVLALHSHRDGHNVIHLYSDRPIPDDAISIPGSKVCFRKEETKAGKFAYRAISDDDSEGRMPSLMESVLDGVILKILPGKRTYSLARSVVEGVVLFLQNGSGVFESVNSIPNEGRVIVFVQKGLKDDLLQCFPPGKKPTFGDSIYREWIETKAFDASWFSGFDNEASKDIKSIRCLMPRLAPEGIRLAGGIRIGESDYLGIPPLLPTARFSPAEAIEFHVVRDGVETQCQMDPNPDEPGAFRFPVSSDELLEGKIQLVAKRSDKTLKRRTVEFRADVFLGADAIKHLPDSAMVFQYREGCGPIDSTAIDRAFMEYGMDPMDLGPKNEAIPRVSVATGSGSRPIRTDLPSSLPAYETSERSMLLVDILYALSARRAGINEGDLRDIFCEALGIRGSFLLWDLVRSWIENCLLNRISSAKWRGSTYFAVRPHLCVLQNGTPSRVVLRGLASSSMRKAVGAEMKKIGGRKIKRFAPCDLVPVPDIWEADSASSFEAVASVVGLRFFTLPTPVLCPLREISVIAPPAPTRFETHRKWDWEKGTFADPAKTQEGVSTEIAWRRRDDAPDHFRISKDGTETFWTKSRNWALLLGYALEGRKAFSMNDRSTLVRSLKGGVYIPLVQGRFLSATSPIVPGPVIGNLTTTYSYPFHSAEDAAKFMDMFWGKTPLNVQLLKSLSGWLFAEAARAARRKENAVMLPEPYRRIFAEMGGFPQGIALSLARYPQESIPIITRRLDALGVER